MCIKTSMQHQSLSLSLSLSISLSLSPHACMTCYVIIQYARTHRSTDYWQDAHRASAKRKSRGCGRRDRRREAMQLSWREDPEKLTFIVLDRARLPIPAPLGLLRSPGISIATSDRITCIHSVRARATLASHPRTRLSFGIHNRVKLEARVLQPVARM